MKTLLATKTVATVLISSISLLFLIGISPSIADNHLSLANKPVICGSFVDIKKDMIQGYGEETEEIIGISEQGQIVHVKLSSEKTYTIVEMHVSGMACIIAAGELIGTGSTL